MCQMCWCVGTVKLLTRWNSLPMTWCSPGEGLHKDALGYARQSTQISTWQKPTYVAFILIQPLYKIKSIFSIYLLVFYNLFAQKYNVTCTQIHTMSWKLPSAKHQARCQNNLSNIETKIPCKSRFEGRIQNTFHLHFNNTTYSKPNCLYDIPK